MILATHHADDSARTATPEPSPAGDAQPWLPDWALETLAELDGHDTTAGGEATA